MNYSKKGVSLITVLMFMLVATIAATATFKWLTSENRSSASRMLRQEAYQSSVAGIDNVRAWMSSNANEVGAVIKQYFDGQKKPVLLNPVLHPINQNGQNYSVWLTGVDASSTTYKLKILSNGTARNGTSHTEAAIIKVSGLYQVKIPQDNLKFTYNKAFHGASNGITGDDMLESGNINGDWVYSNNPKITGDMIVTGFAEFGSTVNLEGDFYLAGDLKNTSGTTIFGLEGVDTASIYIGGDVTCPSGNYLKVFGDLYVKGNISTSCKILVTGNFTLGGLLSKSTHFQNPYYGTSVPVDSADVYVRNNWVFTKKIPEQLELEANNAYNQTSFYVGKNLYFPYKIKAHCNSSWNVWSSSYEKSCGDRDGKREFSVGGYVYQYESSPFVINTQSNGRYGAYMDGYTPPFNTKDFCYDDYTDCKGGRLFSFNAEGIASERVGEWSQTDNVLKNVSDNYWKNIDKMNKYGRMINTSTNHIPDPIQTKNESEWKGATANAYCGTKGYYIGDKFLFNDDVIDNLNKCYSSAKTDGKLYNDEYLVIQWQYDQIEGKTTKELEGKFVIYAPNAVGNANLPPTSSGSIVMLYLEKGATGMLSGKTGSTFNYLIYSLDDIAEINNLHVKGSVIMAENKTLKKYQGKNQFEFDGSILNSLAEAGIIKENPEYTSLAGGSDEGEGSSTSSKYQIDEYYIATSPQLGISLESQYSTREEISSDDDAQSSISPSAVILPRVIYLTRDPVGHLSDYYSIVYLNGPSESENSASVTCNPSLNTSALLYENDHLLSSGIYTCSYSSQNYGDLPFYVFVSGETGKTPAVSFTTSQSEITTSGMLTVSAQVEESTRSQPIKIDVSVSKAPEGWTITPVSGTSMVVRSTSSIETVYTLTLTPNVSPVDLFTITTTATAKQGSVYFHLISPMEGCTITAPATERVIMTGYVSVSRGTIAQYCNKTENINICKEKGYDEKVRSLDCDDLVTGEWIRASGTNVTVTDMNNKWSVGTNTSISLQGQNNVPYYCELILPTENNSILQTEENNDYTLYASLKRKKFYVTVKTKDIVNSGTSVSVLYKSSGDEYVNGTSTICEKNEDKDLVCELYAGWALKTTYTLEGEDKFSRWECEGNNCPIPASNGIEYTLPQITSNNTITAVFNDVDKHCFYEDFTELTAFCSGSATKCINNCEGGSGSSCTVSGAEAEWQLMYPNNGNSANIAPVIQNGYIKSGSNKVTNYSTIVLSTKEAGIHGTMTTLIQTAVLGDNTQSLNSGFIFSSDATASTFTILNIYGNSNENKALTARVCKGSTNKGSSVRNENCSEATFKDASSNAITMNAEDMIKLEIELTLENKLKITATVNGYTGYAELDISSYLGSRDEHSHYVGFDISDPSFKIYDIGWSSLYFSDECFTVPKVSCSFAANYLGGIVPKNKDVTPWVGLSSWYEEHDCYITNYYNGCDNSTGNSAWGCNGTVFNKNWYQTWQAEYDVNGNYFGKKLSNSTYNFSTEGDHGTVLTYTYGTRVISRAVNDAKVKITCSEESSLNGAWSSCGSFWVGDVAYCSQNAEILSASATPKYGIENQILEIPVSDDDGILNLRKATLWIDISNFTESENDKIVVYLKDVNGIQSIPREINGNGSFSFDVNDMSNLDSFNPQSIKSIVLKSSLYPYQVNSILSSCPNALGISNCRASYNGISWTLTSTISNLEGAAPNGCSVTEGVSKKLENVSCPSNGSFTFTEEGLYDQVNFSGNSVTRTFEIKAQSNDGGEVSCTTEPVTLSPITTICSIDNYVVETGAEMPTLSFYFDGCPSYGCEYTAKIGDEESVSGIVSGNGSWTPTVNILPALKPDDYTYTISVFGATTECGTVKVEKSANSAVASNCQIEKDGVKLENYKFTADVTPAANGSEWKMQVVVFYNGVEVKKEPKEPKKGTGDHFDQPIPTKDLIAGMYSAQLFLNGERVSGCLLPFEVGETSSSSSAPSSSSAAPAVSVTCPSDITNQNPDNIISVNATVNNCSGSDCVIQILYNGVIKNSNNELYFYDTEASKQRTYTLKASKGSSNYDECPFKVTFVSPIVESSSSAQSKCIPFVNGTWGYGKNCFSSGLANHAEGKCYTLQDGREDVQWINNNATDTWWWKETSCY